ncbi:MAG: PDZ domain-containing protein [bacterium]|nr:PDZ domain-containing protein [bacterium]
MPTQFYKKYIFLLLSIVIVVSFVIISRNYFISKWLPQDPSLVEGTSLSKMPTSTQMIDTTSQVAQKTPTCISTKSNNVTDSLDVPKLFPDFKWTKVSKTVMEEKEFSSGYISFRKFSDQDYTKIDSLKGEAWSIIYEYGSPPDYSINEKFDSSFAEKFPKEDWVWKTNVHGYEIMGGAADGPTSGVYGLVKIENGKLRAVVIDRSGSYKGTFPDDAELIATTYTIFLSDPVSLSEVLPNYAPAPYLGVLHTAVNHEIQREKNLSVDYGALVITDSSFESAVMTDSPASKAGIKDGDVILAVNNQPINQTNQLTKLLSQYCPSDIIILHVLSHSIEKDVSVTLAEY